MRPHARVLAWRGFALAGLCALAACAGAQKKARVEIHCEDPQAELTVDGVPRGTAGDYSGHHKLLLAPGAHTVELRSHGAVETRRLQVGPEDDLTLNVALQAGSGGGANR